MVPHRINLRGPWDFSWWPDGESVTGPASKTGSVTMPKEWRELFGDLSGRAVFRRKFHRPTNLEDHERVFVVCTEVRGVGNVCLNDQPIGSFDETTSSAEFDVTSTMKPFNDLQIEIGFNPGQNPETSGGLYGVVALEIRHESFGRH